MAAAIMRAFRSLKLLSGTGGAQLMEFALALPILLVIMIAIFDFGGAWNVKQKLANAAREGTRIGSEAPASDLTSSGCASPSATCPCSIQAIADEVKQYMVNANLNASCLTPGTPSSSSGLTWTYTCGNGTSVVINRGYTFTDTNGKTVVGTQVSVTYPYTWKVNTVLGLLHNLLPGASVTLPSNINSTSTMQNFAGS